MIFTLYFLSYITQLLLLPSIVYVTLMIAIYILYDQILKKKDDLFKIFLVILPTLSPLYFNEVKFDVSVFFFLSINPIFIAGLFFLYRNFLTIDYRKLNFYYLLYIFLFIYVLIQVIILYLTDQTNNQGLTYSFKAILYISPIFINYNNDLINFKKQILKIVYLSLIMIYFKEIINPFDTVQVTGHLAFLAIAFPGLIIFYKFNFKNILIYLPALYIIMPQSYTVISIFLLSHVLFFFRKFGIVLNKLNLIFFINLQVLILISISFINILITNYNPDNFFYTKFLYDRMPLWIASIQNLEYFQFKSEILKITSQNIITPLGSNEIWLGGAHNYFLIMTTKLGLIPGVFLLVLLNLFIIKLYNNIKNTLYLKGNILGLLFISLISSFSIFSTSSAAYSGSIGFIFFLLLGSLNSLISSNKKINL